MAGSRESLFRSWLRLASRPLLDDTYINQLYPITISDGWEDAYNKEEFLGGALTRSQCDNIDIELTDAALPILDLVLAAIPLAPQY